MATAHSIVGFTTCACLLIFYAAGEPFGTINDIGNAALGLLSLILAWLLPTSRVLVGVAAVGAVLTVVGTVLVVTGVTGYYLAGLWSSAGFALIGAWLVGSVRQVGRAGMVAGVLMLFGLIGVPGIFLGIDDLDTAPWWTFVAGFSWAGTYLLFPLWSLRLARQNRPERVG